jgi:hypothetical protein
MEELTPEVVLPPTKYAQLNDKDLHTSSYYKEVREIEKG